MFEKPKLKCPEDKSKCDCLTTCPPDLSEDCPDKENPERCCQGCMADEEIQDEQSSDVEAKISDNILLNKWRQISALLKARVKIEMDRQRTNFKNHTFSSIYSRMCPLPKMKYFVVVKC